MSQLLLRLRAELQATDDAERQAELLARIAGQLARLGQFDQARQAIAELRAIYGDGRSGRATVWIMLAEGLVHFYSECHALALDRMTRAQVLAVAMKLSDVVAIVSAWKAQIEFETPKYDAMIQSLNIGLTHVSDDDLDAQTRLAIVLSNSFMICGDVDEAQRWFIRGRNYALRNGDQASIEALLYNRAALGILICERDGA